MKTRDLVAATIAMVLLVPVALPTRASATNEAAVIGFQPAFPTGTDYDVLTATLPGLGLLLDSNADGKLNDEYCDTNGEARLQLVGATFGVLVAAGTVCGASPSPIKEGCFAALTVAALALQSDAIIITQCSTQDGFIDGAQLEAAFENTKHAIASGLERNLRRCDALVSLRLPQAFGGRAEEVRDLLEFRIGQFEALGQFPTASQQARVSLELGKTALDQGKYKVAYGHWCTSYAKLLNAG